MVVVRVSKERWGGSVYYNPRYLARLMVQILYFPTFRNSISRYLYCGFCVAIDVSLLL